MSESADRVRELLEHVSEALALQASVNVEEDGRIIRATLAFKTATRDQPPSAGVRVVVDAAGYRERREQALQRQADEAAADAVRSKRPVALDAMSATERKVVHEYLKDRDDVETYSEGTEPDRHLVVSPLSR
jgi:spoIIIJ-associated protein